MGSTSRLYIREPTSVASASSWAALMHFTEEFVLPDHDGTDDEGLQTVILRFTLLGGCKHADDSQ